MPDGSLFSNVANVVTVVATTPFPAICSIVGFVFLAISAYSSYSVLGKDPISTSAWQKSLIFISLILSVLFFVASGSLAFGDKPQNLLQKIDNKTAVCSLYKNLRTKWFVRLIVYGDSNQALSLWNLRFLGAPKYKYVFVGDYEELKNYTAAEAVEKIGGSVEGNQHVSAIIFQPKHVFPANARGVLQVIRKLEDQQGGISFNRLIKSDTLSGDEVKDISDDSDIKKWSWPSYSRYYPHYCRIVQEFRCNKKYNASELMSSFDSDYSPLGFAQKDKDDRCDTVSQVCTAPANWDEFSSRILPNFGARVFLTDNVEIGNLGARYSIEFDQPRTQIIPEIGGIDRITCEMDSQQ